jgi:hypothetical protein
LGIEVHINWYTTVAGLVNLSGAHDDRIALFQRIQRKKQAPAEVVAAPDWQVRVFGCGYFLPRIRVRRILRSRDFA